jgi:2-polyprenyl-3-methyl-5-hydroxy-6-metoxy-1,4-benzoquinol methylase
MFEIQMPDRAGLFDDLSQAEVVARYRRNFHLGPEISMDHVRRHVELEGSLTDRLIAAPSAERASMFEAAYTELYSNLPWLASTTFSGGLEPWLMLMRPGAKVYEVGSGTGTLARLLARNGFNVTATDITEERGQRSSSEPEGMRWRLTDGVHLDKFEEAESYDYVISNQVAEHLHPEDILTHFRTARILLKPGGSYIARTPHRRHGPQDLTRVFKLDRPVFTHLHEFTYREFDSICRECGYSRVRAIVNLGPVSRKFGLYKASGLFYSYMKLLDAVETPWRRWRTTRKMYRRLSRYLLSSGNVWVRLDR